MSATSRAGITASDEGSEGRSGVVTGRGAWRFFVSRCCFAGAALLTQSKINAQLH